MSVSKVKFGEYNNETIYSYKLENKNGFYAEILNYGGIIRRLVYENTDVVLGRDTIEEYLNNEGYFGAIIGRNSNRIENSEFKLNGKIYKLFNNDGKNNLHGGKCGFDKKIWDVEVLDDEEPSLILTTFSPDGEEGFVGNLDIKVIYKLTNDNALEIHYSGESDADTLVNMTNHSYFNLNGHTSGEVDNHLLWLDSNFYTPNNRECVPTGEILSVKNTPFDFTKKAKIGDGFKSQDEQIKMFAGYDHNFVLNSDGYRKVATFEGDKTGIIMQIYTDQKGMQIYSGNVIEKNRICKDGARYDTHYGVCFETQAFPNYTKFSHFPGGFLKKGEKYTTRTTYKFI